MLTLDSKLPILPFWVWGSNFRFKCQKTKWMSWYITIVFSLIFSCNYFLCGFHFHVYLFNIKVGTKWTHCIYCTWFDPRMQFNYELSIFEIWHCAPETCIIEILKNCMHETTKNCLQVAAISPNPQLKKEVYI
jgi:hypothetical protein